MRRCRSLLLSFAILRCELWLVVCCCVLLGVAGVVWCLALLLMVGVCFVPLFWRCTLLFAVRCLLRVLRCVLFVARKCRCLLVSDGV